MPPPETSPSPGALCVRRGDPVRHLLVVEERGGGLRVVDHPDVREPFTVPSEELEVIGSDGASARVLRMLWRSARAAAVVKDSRPVRTAMVLCAGLGTRLRPLTLRFPKPALPFFDGPLVRYSFALLKGAGVERVVINTHHLPELMEATAAREAQRMGLSLSISHEPVIQGTGGGVRDARRHLGDGPFLLLNGDAFMSLDLRALLAQHQARGAAATLAVVPMPPDEKFAALEATPDGDLRRVGGIGLAGGALQPWHFIGAHVIEPSIFDFIPPQGAQDINRTVYLAMVRAGLRVQVCPVALGAWADLGTPHRYLSACEEVLTGLCDLSHLGRAAPLPTQATPHATTVRKFVHSSARVDSPISGWAVIGADAVVEQTVLQRAVVLPGTHLRGEQLLADAIACDELRLGLN